ncbi:hypothetical protein [Allorhizobium ampelinum]|uniref:hypothetical protein n=1 Tax=Allorhizobium ampelinum TaxID=3025782 RepID=UPI001178BA5A|nr:hypothetical protein [Allorhizobium ampelinum]NTA27451.1 hypothetical protein [Allorhizobium ampelinum]
MDTKTREALEASIRHWEENVAAETVDEIKLGSNFCALCWVFGNRGCNGCPVSERTLCRGCIGSPYHRAIDGKCEWSFSGNKQNWLKAAQDELDFLISLRPYDGELNGKT